jgi:mRNA-degrading endonuclease toxin of MazEF toxin-antitoxin module
MKRGEIYYANLNPAVGSEMNKRRPVLVVSNDANNRAADTVTIIPITSNVTRIYHARGFNYSRGQRFIQTFQSAGAASADNL